MHVDRRLLTYLFGFRPVGFDGQRREVGRREIERLYSELRDAFERTLQLDPTLLITSSNVGETYFFERDYAKAIEQLGKTLEMDPEFQQAHIDLARTYSSQGKHTEAQALLAPIYDWFTEGFDTVDLKEAKALLEEFAR